jgi:serine/threonine protein kinase
LIGVGGMGVVYRARHDIIDSEYALKVLAPELVNEKNWQRFITEARALARLDHPNIVKIFNMGVQGEHCLYYVMELLPGRSLADRIAEEGPLSVAEAIEVFSAATQGLGCAHRNGIVHRDVKPSNIMLVQVSAGGSLVVKVVDFGIARLSSADTGSEGHLTTVGEIFGSPLYMSPEQCQGLEVDERSDIYSLGCSFFEALTGRVPFRGATAMQTIAMHVSAPAPTLSATAPAITFEDSLEFLVAKMLKKNPSERYASMQQLEHDFERIRQNKPINLRGDILRTEDNFGNQGEKNAGERESASTSSVAKRSPSDVKASSWNWLIYGLSSFALLAGAVVLYFGFAAHQRVFSDRTEPTKSISASLSTVGRSSAPAVNVSEGRAKADDDSLITVKDFVDASGVKKRRYHFSINDPLQANYSIDGIKHLGVGGNFELLASQPISLDWTDNDIRGLSKFDGQNVRSLNIFTNNLPAVIDTIAGWPDLKFLRLKNSQVQSKEWSALDRLPKLQGLELRRTKYDVAAIKKLKYFPRISSLRLYSGSRNSVVDLLQYLRQRSGLRRLSIARCDLFPEQIADLAHSEKLEKLVFDGIKLKDASISASILCESKTIKELIIDDSNVWPPASRAVLKKKFAVTVLPEGESEASEDKYFSGF